jgi:hypothetical protein
MLTQSIIGMSRRRWQAERPFEGHTKESLRRKLQRPAVRDDVKGQVRQVLAKRERHPISD